MSDPTEVASRIEGIYEYAEAHRGAAVSRPPEISGRFVMLRGAMVLVGSNQSDRANVADTAQFGSYQIDSDSFVYRWEYRKGYTQTLAESAVNTRLTFEGDRRFSVVASDDSVKFLSEVPGQAEFRFFRDRLEYFEGDALVRVWRKL